MKEKYDMVTLGIETSCDETGCALVSERKVLSNIVSSSVHLHKQYGGVVPEIASRYHIEFINEVLKDSLRKAGKKLGDIGLIAVTRGPGLCGSLLTGISFGKALSYALSKPLIGVNHIAAHLYANFLNKRSNDTPKFPFIGLVISGGHTSIFLCRGISDFTILGQTQDDAIGEAFDKVAKVLGLGYPGGPIVEKMAQKFNQGKDCIKFPRVYLGKDSVDFSFSGIKTAVLYYVRDRRINRELVSAVSYAFQEAVFDVVCKKAVLACQKYGISEIVVGGGVAANKRFCGMMDNACSMHDLKLFVPEARFCLDNGAMIAALGESLYKLGWGSEFDLTAEPNLQGVVC